MSRWTVAPLARSLGPHAAAWDALNRERFDSHPLLSSLFIDGLLVHFGHGDEHLCMLEEDGAVKAMLILRRHGRFAWCSFNPSQAQIAPTLVPERRMLDGLIASLPGPALQLDLLCNDPEVGGMLREAVPPTQRMAHALTMRIDLTGSFDAYWAGRPRQLAKNMRRYERRATEEGMAPRMVRLVTPDDVGAGVERYAAIEGAGWKGKQGTALGSTPEQYGFFHDLLVKNAARGQAAVYELWLGEHLAASRLVVSSQGMLVILKTSYDENLARHAPGRLLLRAVIEDAFRTHPGSAIEFYTDATPEQLEWATSHRWIEHMTLYRSAGADAGINLLKAVRGALRRPQAATGEPASRVDVYTHPDALPADVREFLERAEARSVQFGADWYRNLVDTVYPAHEGVRLYTLRRGDKLVAVLPLRFERHRFGWRAYSLSNFYSALYEPALAPGTKAEDLLPLLAAVRAGFPRLASLMLTPMAPGSHAYVVLSEALRMGRWFPFEFFAFGNWFQPVSMAWSDYLAAREGSVRSTIRRTGRKFAAEGGTLELVTRPEDMPAAIAAYEKVYSSSWKKPEPFPAFVPGLLRTTADKGMLRFGLARLHGQPVAVQAWIVTRGRAEIYKLAYDEHYKAFAPGTLLTAMLMEHVIDVDRVSEIDYLIGDDPYKETWMSERRERWGIVAYNLGTPLGLAGLLREALGRTVKHVRSSLQSRPAPEPARTQVTGSEPASAASL